MLKNARIEAIILFLGDLLSLFAGLWLALFIRYYAAPELINFETHLLAFFPVFLFSFLVWFISGLYQKSTLLPAEGVSSILLNAQAVNAIFSAAFFYLVPVPGIAPKTILFFYIVLSTLFMFLWRYSLSGLFFAEKPVKAILVASENIRQEFESALKEHGVKNILILAFVNPEAPDFQRSFAGALKDNPRSKVIADCSHPIFSSVCLDLAPDLADRGLIDVVRLYEVIFDRVPLFDLGTGKLLEDAIVAESVWYAFGKRILDFIISLPLAVVFLILLPFVILAIKLESRGDVFITQERMGRFKKPIKVYKLRTMNFMEDSHWLGENGSNKVTSVGRVLRRLSIDEMPQMWNILRGELSFIGPRSDISGLAKRLSENIPGYDIRYAVTPGITGWAQINQQYSPGNISPQSIEETKIRLAYDLFYIKRRSLGLDLVIALKTLRILLSRAGL